MLQSCPKRRPSRWLCAALLATLTLARPTVAQDAVSGRPTLGLELPGGVRVNVPEASGLRDEDLARILENYAKELRAKEEAKGVPQTTAALAALPVSRTQEKSDAAPAVEGASTQCTIIPEDGGATFDWAPTRRFTVLPTTLLWQPPLANPYEPRFYIKATSLSAAEFDSVNDFNIGGTLAIFRSSPVGCPDQGWQIDLFGMVLSRFAERNYQAATDYRFGLPITFAWGNWSAKLAYEHTSTHLGDEYMEITGALPRDGIREEFTVGLAYRPIEPLRFYGVFGYAFHVSTFSTDDPQPERFNFGAEWSRPVCTGWRGQPFAATDFEIRGDQDYNLNFTVQVGWQWLAPEARPGLRVALEYRDGRSPFGQFIDRDESWIGLALLFDY